MWTLEWLTQTIWQSQCMESLIFISLCWQKPDSMGFQVKPGGLSETDQWSTLLQSNLKDKCSQCSSGVLKSQNFLASWIFGIFQFCPLTPLKMYIFFFSHLLAITALQEVGAVIELMPWSVISSFKCRCLKYYFLLLLHTSSFSLTTKYTSLLVFFPFSSPLCLFGGGLDIKEIKPGCYLQWKLFVYISLQQNLW